MLYLIAILSAWPILTVSFLAYPAWKRLRSTSMNIRPRVIEWPMTYIWTPLHFVSNVIWNVFYGTVAFRELPREWLFSDRVRRHWKDGAGDSRRGGKALYWRAILNAIDPGHIR